MSERIAPRPRHVRVEVSGIVQGVGFRPFCTDWRSVCS